MAVRFLLDEDVNGVIFEGVLLRRPALDMVRVQDVGLLGAPDPVILEWAAREDRLLVSSDQSTMKDQAYSRLAQNLPMPGLFIARQALPIGRVIEELVFLADQSVPGEWEGQIIFLPL